MEVVPLVGGEVVLLLGSSWVPVVVPVMVFSRVASRGSSRGSSRGASHCIVDSAVYSFVLFSFPLLQVILN